MYKFLCFFLMVFCGGAVLAAPGTTPDIKSTVAFSFIKTSSLNTVNYSLHGSFDSVDMDIEGGGFSIAPGFRLGLGKKNDDNHTKGFFFFELPVSLFGGSGQRHAYLTSIPRHISGSVVQMGIGTRFGGSYSPAQNVSILAGVHFEKVFLSFVFEENVLHYSSFDPIKDSDIVWGKKVTPMVGLSIYPSKSFDFAVILNFPTSSDLRTNLSSTMIVADELALSYTKLRSSDAMNVEFKATVCW